MFKGRLQQGGAVTKNSCASWAPFKPTRQGKACMHMHLLLSTVQCTAPHHNLLCSCAGLGIFRLKHRWHGLQDELCRHNAPTKSAAGRGGAASCAAAGACGCVRLLPGGFGREPVLPARADTRWGDCCLVQVVQYRAKQQQQLQKAEQLSLQVVAASAPHELECRNQ